MNDFVIADPGRCIGCRTCEVACVLAHSGEDALDGLTAEKFTPRLKVVKTAKVSMPVQCRQCEDAPCANVCTARAIEQSGNSVQVIQGKCVGCKSCLMACPYGAIELISIVAAAESGGSTGKVDALKCDLCRKHEGGPACVKVCPTKALYEINGFKLQERMKNKRKQAALGAAKF